MSATVTFSKTRITVTENGREVFRYEAEGDELTAPKDWPAGYHGINSDEADYLLEQAGWGWKTEEDEDGYEIDGWDSRTKTITRKAERI